MKTKDTNNMNPPDQPTLAPTPRTDAAKEQYLTGEIGIYGVLDEARTLERELTRLRADLERFTGHGLLDCHAICDQRDTAVAERDQLRAEVERLTPYVSKAILTHGGTMLCSPQVGVAFNEMQVRAERAETALATERARLDWLAVSDTWFDYPATESFNPETFRDAIDAAMKDQP
jgi:hypothetical protein